MRVLFFVISTLVPVTCMTPTLDFYHPEYPVKILEGPTGDYYLLEPGGAIYKRDQ